MSRHEAEITAVYAVATAERLGWSDDDLRALRLAALDGSMFGEFLKHIEALRHNNSDHVPEDVARAFAAISPLIQPMNDAQATGSG